MTHLDLCLITRSKARNHLALRLTTRLKARNTQRHALRLTARSKAMTHLALRLTARSEARNIYIYTPPFREGPSGLYQAYLESVQTLHEIEVWSSHQQPIHPC